MCMSYLLLLHYHERGITKVWTGLKTGMENRMENGIENGTENGNVFQSNAPFSNTLALPPPACPQYGLCLTQLRERQPYATFQSARSSDGS